MKEIYVKMTAPDDFAVEQNHKIICKGVSILETYKDYGNKPKAYFEIGECECELVNKQFEELQKDIKYYKEAIHDINIMFNGRK